MINKLIQFSGTMPEMDFIHYRHVMVSSYSDPESADDAFKGSLGIWTTEELPKDSITDYEIAFNHPVEISRVSFFSSGAFRVDITFLLYADNIFSTVSVLTTPFSHICRLKDTIEKIHN